MCSDIGVMWEITRAGVERLANWWGGCWEVLEQGSEVCHHHSRHGVNPSLEPHCRHPWRPMVLSGDNTPLSLSASVFSGFLIRVCLNALGWMLGL